MVGLASPVHRVSGAPRFYLGYTLGMSLAGIILAAALLPLNVALVATTSVTQRAVFVALVVFGLAVLDALGRTPQAHRQVPQKLSLSALPLGRLGLVYGFDIGLQATTRKVSSLTWVAIIGAVTLGSEATVLSVLAILVAVNAGTIALLSLGDQRCITGTRYWGRSAYEWARSAQLMGAASAVVASAAVTMTAV
jgi:hypothetical protein